MFLAPNIIILIKEGSGPKSEQNWLNTLVYITASFNHGLSLAGRGGGELWGLESSLPSLPGVTAPENWGYVAPQGGPPAPRPFRGLIGRRGRRRGGPGPVRDPGIGPAGKGRDGKGKERKRKRKVRGEMISQCLAPWQALLYEIQSLFFMRSKLSK